MAAPPPNPQDSMKSTWRRHPENWHFPHKLFNFFDVQPTYLNRDPPVYSKDTPVPYLADWESWRWVIFHASIPLLLHQAIYSFTGYNFGHVAAFAWYSIWFKLIGIHEMRKLRDMGYVWGYLDGDKHARDEIPDVRVGRVLVSVVATTTLRSIMSVYVTYDPKAPPSTITWWWLPLELGLYSVVLDFWFYWYHRVMHDNDWLWQFHRTHHLTKHPNPLLSLYADTEQEIMDIAGIPFLTWLTIRAMGLPMGYYDWWVCNQFIVFVEMFGHSGLRIQASPPSTVTPLLRLAGCELVIEDHDLHHRKGWKKSVNYGKQTRLWDRLFGTLGQRVENVEGNLDYDHPVTMPIFGAPKAPEGWIVPPPGTHGEVKGGPVNGHAGTNGATRDTNGVARRQKEAEAANNEKTRLK